MKRIKILLVLAAVLVAAVNIKVIMDKGGLDQTPPEITIASDVLEVSVHAEESAYLEGVSAWDNRDGDISDQVLVEHLSQLTGENTVKVTYAAFDEAGNSATATRTLCFTDYTGPRFGLTKPLKYGVGATVTLMDRLTAEDDLAGVITQKIRIASQNLSNDIAGIYHITVQVTNDLGDTSVLSLPVVIAEMNGASPEITLSQYIVYIHQGEEFDPGQYLVDVKDPAADTEPDISQVEIQSTVNTDVPGTYDIAYSYKGQKETAQVLLTLVVME